MFSKNKEVDVSWKKVSRNTVLPTAVLKERRFESWDFMYKEMYTRPMNANEDSQSYDGAHG